MVIQSATHFASLISVHVGTIECWVLGRGNKQGKIEGVEKYFRYTSGRTVVVSSDHALTQS